MLQCCSTANNGALLINSVHVRSSLYKFITLLSRLFHTGTTLSLKKCLRTHDAQCARAQDASPQTLGGPTTVANVNKIVTDAFFF